MKDCRNQIIASGVVADITQKKRYSIIKFVTKQIGHSKNVTLNMIYYGDIPSWVKPPHTSVNITGYIENVLFRDDFGQNKCKQRYVIQEFSHRTSQAMEAFGVEGMYGAPHEFKVLLSGKVVVFNTEKEWLRCTLETDAPDDAKVTVQMSMRKPQNMPMKINKNDNICCICTADISYKPRKNGKVNVFEDLMVSDLAKIS